jgi:hypothetical protein
MGVPESGGDGSVRYKRFRVDFVMMPKNYLSTRYQWSINDCLPEGHTAVLSHWQVRQQSCQ